MSNIINIATRLLLSTMVLIGMLVYGELAFANQDPTAKICEKYNVNFPLTYTIDPTNADPSKRIVTISFNGTCSSDPDGKLIKDANGNAIQPPQYEGAQYIWSLGLNNSDFGPNITATYDKAGQKVITLWFIDDHGAQSSSTLNIYVYERLSLPPFQPIPVNYPPISDPGGPYVALLGESITFDGSKSVDIDADAYQFTTAGLQYGWDMGDGCQYNELFYSSILGVPGFDSFIWFDGDGNITPHVSTDNDNVSHLSYTSNPGVNCVSTGTRPTHLYQLPGQYTAKLTVVDDLYPTGKNVTYNGSNVYLPPGIGAATTTVIINRRPIAVMLAPTEGSQGVSITFDGTASYDPDSQAITYLWDFGDGATSEDINPTHTFMQSGQYQVSLIVNDGYHSSIPVSQNIEISDLSWLVPVLNILLQ